MRRPEGLVPLLTCLSFVLTVHPQRVAAQVAVSFSGIAAQPRLTVELGGTRERIGGIWAGGAVVIASRVVTLSFRALSGRMEPIDNTTALNRDGGEMGGSLRLSPLTWIGIDAGYTVRAFNSSAGYQEWRIPHVGATISGTLGHRALRAYLSGAYLPSVKVSGLDTPDLGIAAEAGLTAEPHGAPLYFKVSYRLERYDFPTQTASRLEQYDQITVSLGLRLGTR